MKTKQKRIIISVTNDLVADNRVHKVCTSLHKFGFEILLIGRLLNHNEKIARNYSTKRFRLLFNKGVLFYAEYNLRLFLFLLFSKADIFLSNDLDTLTANFLAAKIRNKQLIYDSHEYFTEVPELIHRPKTQRVWLWLEQLMVPRLQFAYTVCDSIEEVYRQKYGVNFKVIRNVPLSYKSNNLRADKRPKTIIYQGALNVGRGLQKAILSMHFINNAKLLIVGDGDIKAELKELVKSEKLQEKVEFLGRLPMEQLRTITPQADLGLSLEEDLGLNYRYALPNKLFDYIQAQVPVLVSNLPEMKTIVVKYEIGKVSDSENSEQLAKEINASLNEASQRKIWKRNLKTAAAELIWENEEKILLDIFSSLDN